MAEPTEATTSANQPTTPVMVLRVFEPGQAAFQLRKGEEGISVFAPEFVEPHLSEAEVLAEFRSGSAVVARPVSVIEILGLTLVRIEGAANLSPRLREAHCEVQPKPGMSRADFKKALKELE